MDHRINPFGALILAGLALTICIPSRSFAQSESIHNWQNLSFISYKHLTNDDKITFDLQFESDTLILKGKAQTLNNGYDSLHLTSYGVVANEENLLKIKGYLIDKESKHKLFWITAVNYTTAPRDFTLISGSYIQFAAYNKLENAKRGLAFFDAFDLDMVYVGGMYKLVLPYDQQAFRKAREKYVDYDIWRVEYDEVRLIEEAKPNMMVTSASKEEKANNTASL